MENSLRLFGGNLLGPVKFYNGHLGPLIQAKDEADAKWNPCFNLPVLQPRDRLGCQVCVRAYGQGMSWLDVAGSHPAQQ